MDADLNFTESYAKSKVIRLICVSCVLDYLYIDRHYAHELYAFYESSCYENLNYLNWCFEIHFCGERIFSVQREKKPDQNHFFRMQ